MSHSNILNSIQTIHDLLNKEPLLDRKTKVPLNNRQDIENFIQWFLLRKNKFQIYVGAGGSKSVKIWDDVRKEYVGVSKSWRDLLKAMYDGLKYDKEKFLKSASARVGALECLKKYKKKGKKRTVQELTDEQWLDFFKQDDLGNKEIVWEVLDKLGPFRFAWSLRWFFSNDLADTTKRNKALSDIVNQEIVMAPGDQDINNVSKLLAEIVKLPFRNIVTTNYDHYIDWFLKKEKERKRNDGKRFEFVEVYDTSSLIQSFQKYDPRLFYLHGKAETPSSNLIFDKYDYANLFSQDNEMLGHLIMEFLRYGVLYIGFSLDDQTFDYMESQIKFICEKDKIQRSEIPRSYAFIRHPEISAEEKNALRALFNIIVIEYDEYDDVAKIIENVNKIIEYTKALKITEWINNETSQDVQRLKNEVERLKKSGIQHYLNGDLKESRVDFEKALGHTMFWNCLEPENLRTVCEIRRRLALTRSKLKWEEAQKNPPDKETEDAIASIVTNAKILLNEFKSERKGTKPDQAWIVEDYLLDMLDARLKYQSGEFPIALEEFKKAQAQIEKGRNNPIKATENKIDSGTYEESDINLLETFYFAKCQIDRANAMLEIPPDEKKMNKVAKDAEKLHTKLKNSKTSKENDLKIKEFGNIVIIAKWAQAYGKLRNFGRFIDTSHAAENLKDLKKINEILEDGWDYAMCQGAYASTDEKHRCMPSSRWETVKHRSRCRALALMWFNDRSRESDLTDAYKSIQKAIELTYNSNKPALDFQHVRNLLEAVRLNALTNFVDESLEKEDKPSNSPMCFAASYHYLKSAFKTIEDLQKKRPGTDDPYINWILIQAYEIGSVWKLVFKKFLDPVPDDKKPELLDTFLRESNHRKFVVDRYEEFGEDVLKGKEKVQERIKGFKRVFDQVYNSLSETETK